ncbi:hypothetical protein MTO96_020562 [Rhipicephalus appendiculatus]
MPRQAPRKAGCIGESARRQPRFSAGEERSIIRLTSTAVRAEAGFSAGGSFAAERRLALYQRGGGCSGSHARYLSKDVVDRVT